jgi:hypothetical protein
VTRPVIRRSKERNIPLWLTLPIVGKSPIYRLIFAGARLHSDFLFSPLMHTCTGSAYGGASLLFAPSSLIVSFGGSVYWIGVMYLITAGTFFFSACLGMYISLTSVMSPEDKRRKKWAVTLFIVTVVVTILSCGKLDVRHLPRPILVHLPCQRR